MAYVGEKKDAFIILVGGNFKNTLVRIRLRERIIFKRILKE